MEKKKDGALSLATSSRQRLFHGDKTAARVHDRGVNPTRPYYNVRRNFTKSAIFGLFAERT
jgi:hypothetical protein